MQKIKSVIIRPILTEKVTLMSEDLKKYAFEVTKDANKLQIKDAIEKKFDVKVTDVTTINVKGKRKEMSVRSGGRVIRTRGRRRDWKKAIVTLHKEDSIDFYQGETAV
ncbi:MAG: 50S ribosomal protein L23 [Candidatus Marinimicrobia bacterium]|nr:50S ribosomal protein L23 [Candidatus Neomarinimicrobiota bacterium]